ncbi:MAG: DNA-binding protein [Candidatus Moranbacteria bacterium]|nr:DNA-binding protein [Candidatus Moranbacteria bacterium]
MVTKLLSPNELRAIFKISKPTETRWRNAGKLPAPLVLGRRVYYRVADIEKMIDNKQ